MALLDHEGGAEYPYMRDDVFDGLLIAIPTVSGLDVQSADKLSGRILVKAGVSLMSWGENIPISVVEIAPGRTRVSITSTPKTGILFGGAFDLGKNRRNIENVLDALSRVLRDRPPVPAESLQAKAPESVLDLLERLGSLKAQGVLTEEEFQTQKAKLLGGNPTPPPPASPRVPLPPKPAPQQNIDSHTVFCPACGKRLKVPARLAGRRAKCPGCSQAIDLPSSPD